MVKRTEIEIRTHQRTEALDISGQVNAAVGRSGIGDGLCCVISLHTTAGVTVNENADPDVCRDLLWKLSQLVPHGDDFRHREGNSDSHVKASLMGLSAQLPVENGALVAGTWQGIYLCEFDGPRSRRVSVTVIGD